MPVRFDEYRERAGEIDRAPREGSNAERILSFLLSPPEKGFTPGEIADATDVPAGSVGPTLQRLHERGLVRHEEPYWAIGDDDRIASYGALLRSLETLQDRYGDEGWADVDPAADTG